MTMNTTHAHTHALTEAPVVDRRLSIDARLGSASAFLTRAGQGFSRWSLVLVLIAFGLYKFTAVEAAAIRPMVEHSPLMSWLYRVTSEQGASNVVGLVELITAALLGWHRWSPRVATLGGALAMATFLVTLSFLFTTPGVGENPDAVGFLIKDVFLFGSALVATAASARAAGQRALDRAASR
jgi:uncharacterized membrane protein YkgB